MVCFGSFLLDFTSLFDTKKRGGKRVEEIRKGIWRFLLRGVFTFGSGTQVKKQVYKEDSTWKKIHESDAAGNVSIWITTKAFEAPCKEW